MENYLLLQFHTYKTDRRGMIIGISNRSVVSNFYILVLFNHWARHKRRRRPRGTWWPQNWTYPILRAQAKPWTSRESSQSRSSSSRGLLLGRAWHWTRKQLRCRKTTWENEIAPSNCRLNCTGLFLGTRISVNGLRGWHNVFKGASGCCGTVSI